MAFCIAVSTSCYDFISQRCGWRWKIATIIIFVAIGAIFLILNDPVSTIIGHFTFDPENGWFRVNTWNSAIGNIALSPVTGYSFGDVGDPNDFFARASIDCVYLVLALRFGLPAVIMLIMANFASFWPRGPKYNLRTIDPNGIYWETGFTLALVVIMFAGLTVHYWNAMWMMWGLLIGTRASLKEYRFSQNRLNGITRKRSW
jgi:hypothetical protein